jgi:hypothetical protein
MAQIRYEAKNVSLNESRVVRQIADMSVISFLKIISGINVSKKLKRVSLNINLSTNKYLIIKFSIKIMQVLMRGFRTIE